LLLDERIDDVRRAVLEYRRLIESDLGVLKACDDACDQIAIGRQCLSEASLAGLGIKHGQVGERTACIRCYQVTATVIVRRNIRSNLVHRASRSRLVIIIVIPGFRATTQGDRVALDLQVIFDLLASAGQMLV
jgi:hypothetical protein